jgi:spermidine synthase
MSAWTELAQAKLPCGDLLTLRRRDCDFEIRLNLYELMSSRNPASERHLARLAGAAIDAAEPCILIGGLGLGYTARAVLDEVGPGARIVVAELIEEVIAWNRGAVGEAAGRPLDDPRLEVVAGDVADVLLARPAGFDAILMDVDNGPEAVMFPGNRNLYTPAGLALMLSSLRPGGVLALWAAEPSAGFEAILAASGLAQRVPVHVHAAAGAVEHVIYLLRAEAGGDSPALRQGRSTLTSVGPRGRRGAGDDREGEPAGSGAAAAMALRLRPFGTRADPDDEA